MKLLNTIFYLLAASAMSAAASIPEDEESVNLYARDAEEMPSIHTRRVIARDLEHVYNLERRAEGIWNRAAEAKKDLGTRARRKCSYNCMNPQGRPSDGMCVDKGCSHCGGYANNHHCIDY